MLGGGPLGAEPTHYYVGGGGLTKLKSGGVLNETQQSVSTILSNNN